jgi:hypothetical protein
MNISDTGVPPEDPNDKSMEMLGCLLVLGSGAVMIAFFFLLYEIIF